MCVWEKERVRYRLNLFWNEKINYSCIQPTTAPLIPNHTQRQQVEAEKAKANYRKSGITRVKADQKGTPDTLYSHSISTLCLLPPFGPKNSFFLFFPFRFSRNLLLKHSTDAAFYTEWTAYARHIRQVIFQAAYLFHVVFHHPKHGIYTLWYTAFASRAEGASAKRCHSYFCLSIPQTTDFHRIVRVKKKREEDEWTK